MNQGSYRRRFWDACCGHVISGIPRVCFSVEVSPGLRLYGWPHHEGLKRTSLLPSPKRQVGRAQNRKNSTLRRSMKGSKDIESSTLANTASHCLTLSRPALYLISLP